MLHPHAQVYNSNVSYVASVSFPGARRTVSVCLVVRLVSLPQRAKDDLEQRLQPFAADVVCYNANDSFCLIHQWVYRPLDWSERAQSGLFTARFECSGMSRSFFIFCMRNIGIHHSTLEGRLPVAERFAFLSEPSPLGYEQLSHFAAYGAPSPATFSERSQPLYEQISYKRYSHRHSCPAK